MGYHLGAALALTLSRAGVLKTGDVSIVDRTVFLEP
jgi:hypothetical protein